MKKRRLGIDDVSAELLKAGGETAIGVLHGLSNKICNAETARLLEKRNKCKGYGATIQYCGPLPLSL